MKSELWTYKCGRPPFRVVAYERADRGGAIYVRYSHPERTGKDRRLRCALAGAPVIRNARGALITRAVQALEVLVSEFQIKLARGEHTDDVENDTDAEFDTYASADRPLTITDGFTEALDLNGSGMYSMKKPRWEEVRRARRRIERILGPHAVWADLKPRDANKIWRTLASEYKRAIDADPQSRPCGFRQTEVTVDTLFVVAKWLREQKRIPAEALPRIENWRQDLKDEWQEQTGEIIGEDAQPRHTRDEVAAIFQVGLRHPEADPRFVALFELGGEQRLGQVVRVTRRHLSLIPPTGGEAHGLLGVLQVPPCGKKKTSPIGLTASSLEVVQRALSGYLSHLEAAYQANEIRDYPLFPAGRLRKGRVPVRDHLQPLSRTAALEMFHKVERLSGIEPIQGRGWYGVRRGATDFAEDIEKDERVLNSLSGHTDSATRRKRHQAQHRPEVLAQAARLRDQLRLSPAETKNTQAQAAKNDAIGTQGGTQKKAPPAEAIRRWRKLFFLNALRERATGLEPATSSLGSWHSTN